jgi:aspartate-semialdehyde dehydrogenase
LFGKKVKREEKMSSKVKVGILGATGMVGQYFVSLLHDHPWFEIAYLAASPASAGKKYSEAVAGRWHLPLDLPEAVRNMEVQDVSNVSQAAGKCDLVFSAVDMDKGAIRVIEDEYAAMGLAVVSNNSAHRQTEDVPVIIPEVNSDHLDIIPFQQKRHGWSKGFIIVKPNCSIQSYMLPVSALMKAGYKIDKMILSTLQAVSGAGYPGPSSLDLVDNVIPYAAGEEEKSEVEPPKIWGIIREGKIVSSDSIRISAHCNRVPVLDGHIACVSLQFAGPKPSAEEIVRTWQDFRSVPQNMGLPSAPQHPIIYRPETDRPQPRRDRDAEKGMAVSVGRLRPCNVMDYRFVGLHHNMIRGAAGGSILSAELLKSRGWI